MKIVSVCFTVILLSCFMFIHSYAGDSEKSNQYTQQAAQYYNPNTADQCIALLDKALEENPDNYMALTLLAGAWGDLKRDNNKSLSLYKKALEMNNNYDMAHFGLGLLYADMGKKEEAKKELNAAISLTIKPQVKSDSERALMMLEK